MELKNPSNGDDQPDLVSTGGPCDADESRHFYFEDGDSACSTPYVSAPSSPGRGGGGAAYFYSAPASPMHFVLSSTAFSPPATASSSCESFEFEFSSRCPSPGGGGGAGGSMSSADELFLNGQIRPMKLSSHLQRPQVLAPLLDLDEDEGERGEKREGAAARGRDLRLRSRSVHRRARSLSPLRNPRYQWAEGEEVEADASTKAAETDPKRAEGGEEEASAPSGSASSSRSSSSGRNAKRWIFLKDLLYRSKSEGRERDSERARGAAKEKFWHSISFSPSSKEKSKPTPPSSAPAPPVEAPKPRQKTGPLPAPGARRATNAASRGKRRGAAPSPHERHYTANRAQAEDMRRRTFLPYRQGLFGCLGFTSRSYGAMNGLARTLNPVSSRAS